MSIQSRLLKSIPTSEGNCTHVDVEVYYSKGGMNYFTSRMETRGLYLSVKPVTRSQNMISYMGFSGTKKLVKEMKMFSRKALNEFSPDPELESNLINYILEKNGIKLQSQRSE